MANTIVELPYEYFPDPTKGRPVFNGSVFIGEPDEDPEIEIKRKEVTLRQEDGTEVPILPAGQPLLTGAGGVILFEGSPVVVLVEGAYSLKVLNKQGSQVYYAADVTNGIPLTTDTGVIVFNTLVELIATTSVSVGNRVRTLGYNTIGDGGDNDYLIVEAATGTDDGGTYVDLDTHQAQGLFPKGFVSVKQYGALGDGSTDDTDAIEAAAAEVIANRNSIYYPRESFRILRYIKQPANITSDDATLLIEGKIPDISTSWIDSDINGKLSLQGESTIATTVTNAAEESTGTFSVEYFTGIFKDAKFSFVDFTIGVTAEVGDFLCIQTDCSDQNFCGGFEVTEVNGSVATVMMLNQGTLTFGAITGSVLLIKTVYQSTNVSNIVVRSGRLDVTNIGLLGGAFPVTNGSRSQIYDPLGSTGVTGVIARPSASIALGTFAISGTTGTQVTSTDAASIINLDSDLYFSSGGRNGISSASGSSTTCSGCVSSCNLLDGIIAQSTSFIFATNAVTVQNGRHGAILSGGSNGNFGSAVALQNGFLDSTGDGFNCNASVMLTISAISKENANNGVLATGSAYVRAIGCVCDDNAVNGFNSELSSYIIISTGSAAGNTTQDLIATVAGIIDARGTTFTNSFPIENRYTVDRALITTSTTPVDMRFTVNGTNDAFFMDSSNLSHFGLNTVVGIAARIYASGNVLMSGNMFLAGDNGNYWEFQVNVGGALVLVDTGVSV